MPVGRLLEPVRDVQHRRLGEIVALDLQPDRQAVAVEAAGDRHGRRAREVRGHREDVVQVHRDRIVGLGADRKRRRRRGRTHDHVAASVRAAKVVGDQAAHLLRLQVIRVVVAVRQHVGADENPTLHLGAEAFGARLPVHVGEIGVRRGAVAVAHAIEARQVRRRFGRRDDVVHRHREADVGQRDVDGGCTERAKLGEGGVDRRRDVGVDPGAEILAGQAYANAGKRLRAARHRQRARVVLSWAVERRRVARIMAGHRIQQQREIVRGLRERPGLVEARRERDETVARADAVGRLEAADP